MPMKIIKYIKSLIRDISFMWVIWRAKDFNQLLEVESPLKKVLPGIMYLDLMHYLIKNDGDIPHSGFMHTENDLKDYLVDNYLGIPEISYVGDDKLTVISLSSVYYKWVFVRHYDFKYVYYHRPILIYDLEDPFAPPYMI